MSFTIRNLTGSAVLLDDLGLTIPASTDVDFSDLQPNDVAISEDLVNALSGSPPTLAVLSPLDGTTVLDPTTGVEVVEAHNDPHWGIRGGLLDQLDDVDTTGANPNDVLQLNGSGTYVAVAPSTLAGDIDLDDLGDVDDATPHTAGTVYVFKGDGTNLDVVDFTSDPDVGEAIEDIVGAMGTDGTDTTFTYNDVAGTIQWDVDDVFLRNTGDTLDSGTLTVASGAAINIATGGDLTIQDPPTDPKDATNKEYVDSVAAGLDPKESVRVATLDSDIGGTYIPLGGTGGSGAFTSSDGEIDGVTLEVGDRVLVKNQTDPLENGIYSVTVVNGGSPVTVNMERAEDQDGTPANEVSAGNFTFVEQGSQSDTGWVVQGDGILTLNVDPINWVQFSSVGTINAGIGLTEAGGTVDLNVDDLTVGSTTVVGGDTIAFHDQDGSATASGSQTKKATFTTMLADLDIVNGVTGTGIVVQTGPDTYAARTIEVDAAGPLDGLAVADGDGVSANPTLGLDIQNLPIQTAIDAPNDRVAVWDSSANANVYYSVSDISGALANVNSFETWAAAGNTTGDASIVADSATDTVTLTGGIGISIAFTAASDTLEFTFSQAGMADTAVLPADTVPFFDASNANEPEYRSWANIITDLSLTVSGVESLTASTDEEELGAVVSGTATDPIVGVTIVTLTDPDDDMAADDEFIVHDKSEGSGSPAGANRKMTGQNIADGVAAIIGVPPAGLSVTTINGQEVLTLEDTTRANKVLSVESTAVTWMENNVGNNDWIQIGNANDALSGYIVPMDATIVKAQLHTSDDKNNSKGVDLYINGANSGALLTLTAVNGENSVYDITINTDLAQGDKIRLRGASTGGRIEDTVITVWFKWRGV